MVGCGKIANQRPCIYVPHGTERLGLSTAPHNSHLRYCKGRQPGASNDHFPYQFLTHPESRCQTHNDQASSRAPSLLQIAGASDCSKSSDDDGAPTLAHPHHRMYAIIIKTSGRPTLPPASLARKNPSHTEAEDVVLVRLVEGGQPVADLILGDARAVRVDDIDHLRKEGI